MNDIVKKVLKIVAWVINIPFICMVYGMTLLTSYKIDAIGKWSWAFSLVVVFVYAGGVALRNKVKGGVTVTTILATVVNLIICFSLYASLA